MGSQCVWMCVMDLVCVVIDGIGLWTNIAPACYTPFFSLPALFPVLPFGRVLDHVPRLRYAPSACLTGAIVRHHSMRSMYPTHKIPTVNSNCTSVAVGSADSTQLDSTRLDSTRLDSCVHTGQPRPDHPGSPALIPPAICGAALG